MILRIVDEALRVSWSDICFIRRNFASILLISLVSPVLYLLAFGYGLGFGAQVDGVDYVAFIIPGIISLTTLSSSFSSTSTKVLVQKNYYRSFDELILCPVSVPSIVIGKSLMGVFRGLISCTILYVMGLFVTNGLHLTPTFVLCVILSCFTFSFLGLLAGLIARSHQSVSIINSLVILPMTFLCGTFFSVSSIPEIFQYVLYALPLTHVTECIRASVLDWTFPWFSLLLVFVFCAALYFINYSIIKKGRFSEAIV